MGGNSTMAYARKLHIANDAGWQCGLIMEAGK